MTMVFAKYTHESCLITEERAYCSLLYSHKFTDCDASTTVLLKIRSS